MQPRALPEIMRFFIQAELLDAKPRQELWAESEDEALDIVRALLRQGAAVQIIETAEEAPESA